MSALAAWTLEWRTALGRRRLLVLNVLIPLALVAPIALAGAPAVHRAAVYAVLFALFGTFGSAIPLLRDAERGFVRRVALTPLSPAGILLGRAAATTTLDFLQLAPAAALAGIFRDPVSPVVLLGSLAFANLFGTWVAAAVRSIAEGALFCAVGALFLLHASGVFRTPAGPVGRFIEALAPYRALHEHLLGVAAHGSAALGLAVLLGGALTAVLAKPLLRSLARADARG